MCPGMTLQDVGYAYHGFEFSVVYLNVSVTGCSPYSTTVVEVWKSHGVEHYCPGING